MDNVEIAAKSGNWYKIKYGKQVGWIKSGDQNLTVLPISPVISYLKIKNKVNLFDQPSLLLKKSGTLPPQTVKVMKKTGNGWYLIHTSFGAKWIKY
jgi:uncharacterized protein YgiM (DUF1202 family)